MIIKKILNNNAIVTYDETGRDVIVFGRGLSFSKKVGDRIDQRKVDQRFVLENKGNTRKLEELIRTIPYEQIEVCGHLIVMIKEEYSKPLHENFYLSLIDHVSFAIERKQRGLLTQNPLLWEIRKFYPEEFLLSQKALIIIEQELGIIFDENEAATIAMHISDAAMGDENMMVTKILDIIETSLKIVKYALALDLDEESLSYYRFMTHLKYFAQRVLVQEPSQRENPLREIVCTRFSQAYHCTERISEMLADRYHYVISEDEQVYLTIHINRILEDAQPDN